MYINPRTDPKSVFRRPLRLLAPQLLDVPRLRTFDLYVHYANSEPADLIRVSLQPRPNQGKHSNGTMAHFLE